jgi:rhamnosyltransferase
MSVYIAGVTVLYNPENTIIENVNSYIEDVGILYVVDNSDYKNIELIERLKKIDKIIYIDNKGNKGIAHALNRGAKEAISEGYDFILTMDQDSKASKLMMSMLLDCLDLCKISKIGILSPFHASKYHQKSMQKGCVVKQMVMTSGNLLSLEAYKHIGPFKDELFLDYVDNEYCLRLQKYGYSVIQVSDAILYHNLGELSMHNFFGKKIYCYNYTPIRYYYRTRNVIVTNRQYGYVDYSYLKELFKDSIKITLYETNKLKKFKYIYLGIIDAIRRKMGKYDR